ncbi:MAG: shikimate dehydrogenase [Kineosporiaceae bacterium]
MRRQRPTRGLLTAGRRAAVLGSPIGHSLSPALHRAAYQALGLDWSYQAVDVDESSLAPFVAELDAAWAGLSLTMPLKRAVLPLLDTADDLVRRTGSCNTVVLAGGVRHGHNTDVAGIVAAIGEAGPPPPGPGVVLGGGATASSAVVALAGLGADPLVVLARDPDRAAAVPAVAARAGGRARVGPLTEAAVTEALASAAVVVSTLPSGAADRLAPTVAAAAASGTLLDVVYEPWPTALAAAWQASGGRVVAGDAMLLHQAAVQVRLMTGCEPPVAAMRTGMTAERRRRLALPG